MKKLVPEGIFSFIDGEAALPINADDGSIRLIPAGTVGGESILRAVLIDSVTVIGKKEAREVKMSFWRRVRRRFLQVIIRCF